MSSAEVTVARLRPQIDDILDALRASAARHGLQAYLVGGFVRDRLLGHDAKDIDLVCVGSPGMPLLEDLATALGWAPPQSFERFGTGQVRGDGFIVEVVRARAESYDPASRRPQVRPGSLEDDVFRRDFTVNALCQTLDGHLIDLTGHGLDDLRAGLLRTPLAPDATFGEDPLRMFRAARFVAQLGFQLAPGVVTAMSRMAERSGILSAERVAAELQRLLLSEHPRQGLEVLRDGGLLEALMPEVAAMVGVEQGGWHTHDVFDHSTRTVAGVARDPVTRLAALVHDIGKPPTHAIAADGRHTFHDHPQVGARIATRLLERLRLPGEVIDDVARLTLHHLRPIQYRAEEWSDAAVRRLVRDIGPLRDRLLDLARADTRASAYPDTHGIDHLEARMQCLDEGGVLSGLRPALNGDEVQALAGGRPPGPWIGAVHRALEDAVLEGELAAGDAEGARAWLLARPQLWAEPQRPGA
ncbi:MAG: CCA tRNA nucleotidyltransferase [Candidatus Dormibacteria bacterium]